jgi:hypothetical protein
VGDIIEINNERYPECIAYVEKGNPEMDIIKIINLDGEIQYEIFSDEIKRISSIIELENGNFAIFARNDENDPMVYIYTLDGTQEHEFELPEI